MKSNKRDDKKRALADGDLHRAEAELCGGNYSTMAKEKQITKRYRNFATVVYPESAPADWQDKLSDMIIPAFISPLHDQDRNDADDEPKKAHYHVVLAYDAPKTVEQAQAVFDQIGGVGLVIVQSIRGMARYLCHLDNPEKHQYDTDKVRALSGADYPGTIGLSTDKYKAIGEMIMYCEENSIVSYSELLKYCMTERYDWFRVLCDNGTVVIKEYLKSKFWTENHTEQYH